MGAESGRAIRVVKICCREDQIEDGQHQGVALTVKPFGENCRGEFDGGFDIAVDIVLFVPLRTDACIPLAGAWQVKERIWRGWRRRHVDVRPVRELARSSIALQWVISVSKVSAVSNSRPSAIMAS